MSTYVLAVDNGVTGSVALLGTDGTAVLTSTPVKDTVIGKSGRMAKRVDVVELMQWIKNAIPTGRPGTISQCHAYIERPFTGSAMMINTTTLSARAFEATVIALELLGIGYDVVDSREWQKVMLPGVKGRENLKRASYAKGVQLYPALKPYIDEIGDADGLLIAHWGVGQ